MQNVEGEVGYRVNLVQCVLNVNSPKGEALLPIMQLTSQTVALVRYSSEHT